MFYWHMQRLLQSRLHQSVASIDEVVGSFVLLTHFHFDIRLHFHDSCFPTRRDYFLISFLFERNMLPYRLFMFHQINCLIKTYSVFLFLLVGLECSC